MFTSLRWRLTFWFIILTTLVYAATVVCGLWLFHAEMIRLVDQELSALADELRPSIVITSDGKPSLQEWSMHGHVPFRFTQTIQIYDDRGKLLEQHGPRGVPILDLNRHEITEAGLYHARIYATPLFDGRKLVGFIQLQLSLKNIERSVNQFSQTMTLLAPFLLLGLGAAGYLFSRKAAGPVEESFYVLQRFLSDAGHELSTPISIIQANAEALEMDLPEEGSSNKNRLSVIFRSTDRMSNLVQDLMLLSKMESPVQQRSTSHLLDLAKLTHAVVEEMSELFKAKSIALKAEHITSSFVHGDSDSLKRLLTNLLQNALRYTDENGEVRVKLDNNGRQVALSVADSGIGIPPESVPLIFDRFYRVDKSRSRAQGGAGLGLSIVKAIVEAHKGRIEVQSDLGKGTTFTVIMPAAVKPVARLSSSEP